jgi:hypothetical protein
MICEPLQGFEAERMSNGRLQSGHAEQDPTVGRYEMPSGLSPCELIEPDIHDRSDEDTNGSLNPRNRTVIASS